MILVTGGAGFIGAALVERLHARGERVVVLDDFSRGETLPPLGVKLVKGDVRDYYDVAEAMAGCDTVLHLAAINGTDNFYERPYDVLEVGIEGTLNVVKAARYFGTVKRLQYFSSSEVYQQPTTIPTPDTERGIVPDFTNPRYSYGGSKIAGELLVINSGIPWQIIRPHNVYGPNMGNGHVIPNLIDKFERGDFTIRGSGAETRTFCHIDDMVTGCLLALDRGAWPSHYNVGGTEEVSIADLATRLHSAMGLPSATLTTSAAPAGETNRRCPDISRLATLGYQPKVSLDEGLRRLVA